MTEAIRHAKDACEISKSAFLDKHLEKTTSNATICNIAFVL